MILYHGGHIEGGEFWPFTHFGTKAAALKRLDDNLAMRPSLDGQAPHLYRCEVDLGNRVIDVPDWHVALPSGIILMLWKHQLLAISQKERNAILSSLNSIQRANPREALMRVHELVRPLGISAIRYENEHEEDRRQHSYCVVSGSQARILDQLSIED